MSLSQRAKQRWQYHTCTARPTWRPYPAAAQHASPPCTAAHAHPQHPRSRTSTPQRPLRRGNHTAEHRTVPAGSVPPAPAPRRTFPAPPRTSHDSSLELKLRLIRITKVGAAIQGQNSRRAFHAPALIGSTRYCRIPGRCTGKPPLHGRLGAWLQARAIAKAGAPISLSP